MQLLNARETRRSLPYQAVVAELELLLRNTKPCLEDLPPRQVIQLPGGASLLMMPAFDDDYTIVKLVTVHRANDPSIRPIVQGDVTVIRTSDGERLMQLDGAALTAIRTASLSVLALRHFAIHPQGPALVIGSGAQAKAHLDALKNVLGIQRAFLSSRNETTAMALIAEMKEMNMEVEWVSSPEEVADQIRIAIACTDSSVPVVPVSLRRETMIVAVGAFQPTMCEVPRLVVQRASNPDSQLIVDTLEGAKLEAGDLLQADVNWSFVQSLSDAMRAPRRASDLTLFKSVGSALWDLAACHVAVKNCPGFLKEDV